MSRHIDEQYRWSEALRERLLDNLRRAEAFRLTQEAYLTRRKEIWASAPKLTAASHAYVRGYLRCAEEMQSRKLYFVRRIIGRPETASAAKWDAMTEELRQACRDHATEACLAWDETGEHPYGPWRAE